MPHLLRADAPASKAREIVPAKKQSLHSKYILFDDDLVYVGSLNLDPRSMFLNTELGVILEAPALAAELRASFETLTSPQNAWRVTRAPEGLVWRSERGERHSQPASGGWQQLWNGMLRMLPRMSLTTS